MRNHGIRFEVLHRNDTGQWEELTWNKLATGMCFWNGCEFQVHPEDVAKFEPENDDICFIEYEWQKQYDYGYESYYGAVLGKAGDLRFTGDIYNGREKATIRLNDVKNIKKCFIKERNGKAWLAPDEVREA